MKRTRARRRITLPHMPRPEPPEQEGNGEPGKVPTLLEAYPVQIERIEASRIEKAGEEVRETLFVDLAIPLRDIQNGVFTSVTSADAKDIVELTVSYRGYIYGLVKIEDNLSDAICMVYRFRLIYNLTNLIRSGSEI